jgi:hypothetical protein
VKAFNAILAADIGTTARLAGSRGGALCRSRATTRPRRMS